MLRAYIQLFGGLILCGFAVAAMVRANLGLGPWDVFHQGLAQKTGLSLGVVFTLTSFVVLTLWIPLRQKPGVGTIANMIVVGIATDTGLWLLPPVEGLAVRYALLLAGIVGTGVGAAAYLATGLGPGARDGVMTGLNSRFGWPIHGVRTGIELFILALGWLCGGTAGIGTIAYALLVGPVLQWCLPSFIRLARTPARAARQASGSGLQSK